jgi:hypothetical protein
VVVTTSFSRISAMASSAEMTLFFLMEPVILPGGRTDDRARGRSSPLLSPAGCAPGSFSLGRVIATHQYLRQRTISLPEDEQYSKNGRVRCSKTLRCTIIKIAPLRLCSGRGPV